MRIPLISDWLEKRQTSGLKNPDPWLQRIFAGPPSRTGIDVNNHTAMHLTAVYACIRIISETVGSLPLKIYRNTGNGKSEAPNHRLYKLLHDSPNPEMTAMTFREMLQAHVLTWGNAYAYIVRDGAGRITQLYPITPDRIWPHRREQDKRLVYAVDMPTKEFRWVWPQDIFHLRGLGWDGIRGYSPIYMAREAIGMGLAAEEFGARFFGQGTHLGGVVQYPEALSEEAYERLKASMQEQYQGLGQSHLLLLLEEGGSFQRLGVPPNEAQFIEARKFQIQEIARIYRMPPHMLADLERATHTNIEHQALEFVTQTLRPWLVRWEQEINFKLLGNDNNYFAEHVVEGLLRGDIQARYNAYAIGRQHGWLNADEIRELENLNPLPEGQGQVYWRPLNVTDAGEEMPPSREEGRSQDDTQVEDRFRRPGWEMEERSAAGRDRLARRHERLFADTFKRIVTREVRDIERKAKKELNERSIGDFRKWLQDYFDEAPGWIKGIMMPTVLTFGESIQEDVAKEVGAEVGLTSRMEKWLDERAAGYAQAHAIESRQQIDAVIRGALDEHEDPLDKVLQRLDEWEEKRPRKEAKELTVRESNRVAELQYKDMGITHKKWHALGAETCEYCEVMDGMVVEIDGEFLADGDELRPEGVTEPMQISGGRPVPPLHRGCVCQIVPGP